MKKLLSDFIYKRPILLVLMHLFRPKVGSFKIDLQSIHNKFVISTTESTSALDLGCCPSPQNRFDAESVIGVDLVENKKNNVIRCALGYEKLPFEDNSFDYLSAYDLIEHIPRFVRGV
ncbi:MAG TPA: methyltransferase domain-containing protein [Flavobacteriales bacterium]|nr:methyltransferase domain-containing protein [Flavobacteriales bacterium]